MIIWEALHKRLPLQGVVYLSRVSAAPGVAGFEPTGTAARLLCALEGQTDVTLTQEQVTTPLVIMPSS